MSKSKRKSKSTLYLFTLANLSRQKVMLRQHTSPSPDAATTHLSHARPRRTHSVHATRGSRARSRDFAASKLVQPRDVLRKPWLHGSERRKLVRFEQPGTLGLDLSDLEGHIVLRRLVP